MAKQVAIINDDTVFLELMREYLSEEGYEAHAFKEADCAYESVRALDPDVIVLDIRMVAPESGWEVLELIKLDRTLSKTPVIVCSADSRQLQDREEVLRRHGCEILPKPFDLDELLRLLERLLA